MKSILFLLSSFLISLFGFSQAGFLDEGFGTGGKVITDLLGQCVTSALQSDGKILVGGTSRKFGTYTCIVIRYLDDGEVDNTYGEQGIAFIPNFWSLTDMKVLENAQMLICGTLNPNFDFAVGKLKPDGSFDSTFGQNGTAVIDFGNPATPIAMQIQNDGKIVLGGSYQVSENYGNVMLVVRLNADGSLDGTFGDKGQIKNYTGYQINCLALQEDGKIITGGQQWPTGAGSRDMFVITRYNADGSVDADFGNVLTDITTDGNDIPYALAVLRDGKIVAAGEAHYISLFDSYMVAVRYNPDGELDKSFGENGISTIMFDDKRSDGQSLLVQEDGKLIISGSVFNSEIEDFALVRLQPEGTLDSSFGVNGKQTTDFGMYDRSTSSLLQNDGKIILVGYDDVTFNYLLTRYNNDIAMPLHFTYFNASPTNNGGIALNWQTAQENNNDYFAVQRSTNNASNFNELTRISSEGNSSQAQTYSYTDNTPLQGTNFYRLKQVDKDGKFSYSQIASATIANGLTVVLYPNPVRDVLNIKGLDAGMSYELSVMTAKGSVVARKEIGNTSSYQWNLKNLSKGVYYLNIISGNKKTTVKFVKE